MTIQVLGLLRRDAARIGGVLGERHLVQWNSKKLQAQLRTVPVEAGYANRPRADEGTRASITFAPVAFLAHLADASHGQAIAVPRPD